MKYIWIILLSASPFTAMAHPIHVSVCEMFHNIDKDQIEITLKIFWDDFEDVLEDRSGESINFGMEDEHPEADKYIVEYIREKFLLSINGKTVVPEFHGREIEDVAMWCYLSVPDIGEIATVTIQNDVMLHWFKDQVNVVHLDCNDKLNSTFFARGRSEETFSFK